MILYAGIIAALSAGLFICRMTFAKSTGVESRRPNYSIPGRLHLVNGTRMFRMYLMLILSIHTSCNKKQNLECLNNKTYDRDLLNQWLSDSDTLTIFRYGDCSYTNQNKPVAQALSDYLIESDSFTFNKPIVFVTYLDYVNDTSNYATMIAQVHNFKRMAYNKLSQHYYKKPISQLRFKERIFIGESSEELYGQGPFPAFIWINKKDTSKYIDPEIQIELDLKMIDYY